jgi:hypothetical protein
MSKSAQSPTHGFPISLRADGTALLHADLSTSAVSLARLAPISEPGDRLVFAIGTITAPGTSMMVQNESRRR